MEAYVAETPAKPFVAVEDHLGVAKSSERLLPIAAARVVLGEVNQGICFGFDDLVLPGDLNALPVVGDRLVEVSEFTMDPSGRALQYQAKPSASAVSSILRPPKAMSHSDQN